MWIRDRWTKIGGPYALLKNYWLRFSSILETLEESRETVFIGKKSIAYYAYLAEICLKRYEKAVIKARGRYIPKAILIADAIQRVDPTVYITDSKLGAEQIKSDGPYKRRIPFMYITLSKR